MEKNINLTVLATNALWHCLNKSEAKGDGLLLHAKIMRSMKKSVIEDNGTQFVFKGGDLPLNEDRLKYVRDVVKKRTTDGIEGVLAEAYCDLLEALDAVEATKEESKKDELESK